MIVIGLVDMQGWLWQLAISLVDTAGIEQYFMFSNTKYSPDLKVNNQ